MNTITQTEPITVVGIELRTSNEMAFEQIPEFWQRFHRESILDQIPGKLSDDVYAVYTNFENEGKNNEGTYSFILGAQVGTVDQVPPHFVSAVIPASRRRIFQVASGHPEQVGGTWQEIWATTGLKKTFVADYECYEESGDIAIYVGIEGDRSSR